MAEQHVAVAGGGLGVGGDHDVGAEIQRALQQRCHGGVVDDHDGPGLMGAGGGLSDVAEVEAGIGRGLDVDHFRAGKIGGGIGGGGQLGDPDPEALQEFGAEDTGHVIAVRRQDQVVAGLEGREQGGGDGGHAGGEGDAGRILQQGQLLFHLLPGRAGHAGVFEGRAVETRQVEGGGADDARGHGVALLQAVGAVVQNVGKALVRGGVS